MSRKILVLIVGGLTVLVFSALASMAAAKETTLKCEGLGACTFSVSGFPTEISIAGGDTVRCSSVSGNGEITGLNAERESTTATVQLLYKECKEQNTIFHFACSNTKTAGNLTTGVLTMHSVALTGTGFQAGVLLTNAGVTFTCAGGFASTQLTGSLIGEYESTCNLNTSLFQSITFGTVGDGLQASTSYTGSSFRLEGKTSHTGSGSYANAALSGAYTFTFNQNVILTCS